MEVKKADVNQLNKVKEITRETIKEIYPKYYPKGAVDYFLDHHSEKNILNDITSGNVYILENEGNSVGTLTIKNNEMCRLFVLPQYQGRGYGRMLMNFAERKIAERYSEICLDASLPTKTIYLNRGYCAQGSKSIRTENGDYLCYDEMKKNVISDAYELNYEGKTFVSKSNSENGEVSEQTVFTYHQKGSILWADYTGGEIQLGFLIGTIKESGILDFYYQHINQNMEIRIGKCHSTPSILEDGKIELQENWQWLNGDMSIGSSIIVEK